MGRLRCIVPADLALELEEPLRRELSAESGVDVIVESRRGERRCGADRRERATGRAHCLERRRIRAKAGRRIADRRLPLIRVARPTLPREAVPFAPRLTFVEPRPISDVEREDIDTARLVARIQSGDDGPLKALYVRYFDRIYSYLRIALRDEYEAEDAAQDVFMRVFEALPRYERRDVPFRAWLFRIAHNSAISRLCRSGRVIVESPADLGRRQAGEIGDGRAPESVDDGEIMALVRELPEAQQHVVVLRYLFELRATEIAKVLGRKPASVRKLHQRALSSLRERLEPIRDELVAA